MRKLKKTLPTTTLILTLITLSLAPLHTQQLKRIKIMVGTTAAYVEVAANNYTRNRGLMYRKSMGANEGMLFVFPDDEPRGFWMKNTLIPLDIAFFNAEGELLNIRTMQPEPGTPDHKLKAYPSAGPARYALEMNAGWFKKNNITLRHSLKLPYKITGQ